MSKQGTDWTLVIALVLLGVTVLVLLIGEPNLVTLLLAATGLVLLAVGLLRRGASPGSG